jgi:hypothetical protein
LILALPMMIYSVVVAALPNYFSALFWLIGKRPLQAVLTAFRRGSCVLAAMPSVRG